MQAAPLQEQFGNIDIYLFDQILKGRITPGMRVLDAGCGFGRNIVYLLRNGFEVFAVDPSAAAIDQVRSMARDLAPALPESNFRVERIEEMSFPDKFADVVICNTVLHFARDEEHFQAMLDGVWRVLKPGGLFFSRLGSSTGVEHLIRHLEGRRYWSPDDSERFLVDDALLRQYTTRLGAELADPLRTTIVHGQRAMTTWVLRKGSK